MNDYEYTFTVFTPTFNRAHTLHRIYKSLKEQTFRDFEWLIVDDGSTDNTRELVEKWQTEADFSIRYFYQENRGKTRAINRGVKEARGNLFLCLDSDDWCAPNALERLKCVWHSIPEDVRHRFSAAVSLCQSPDGQIIGSKFPFDPTDSNAIDIREKYKVKGDKWGFQRTDVLKRFPFPEIGGENFIPEAIVWNRIALHYRERYFNECLLTVDYQKNGLSDSSLTLRIKNPKGTRIFYLECLRLPSSFFLKCKKAINYVRFSLHSGYPLFRIARDAKLLLVLIAIIFPLGLILYRLDCNRFQNVKRKDTE